MEHLSGISGNGQEFTEKNDNSNPSHTNLTVSTALFSGGQGKKHTNTITRKNAKPLLEISYWVIQEFVELPQCIEKNSAKWVTFTDYRSRLKDELEPNATYYAHWLDFDKGNPGKEAVVAVLAELGCDYEVYSSKGAKDDLRKWRALIPSVVSMNAKQWLMVQECLNDLFKARGIEPDRSSESCNQPCFLPNRGEYYDTASIRDGEHFNGIEYFAKEIAYKELAIVLAQQATQERIAESIAKREQRLAEGFDSPIDAFNATYVVEDILLQAGYEQRGTTFRHPESERGSYSASVKDGRVHSLSTSDPLHSDGEGAHDAFSCFCVLLHGGVQSSAIKDAGDNWLAIGGETWNKVKQREYMQRQDLTTSYFEPDVIDGYSIDAANDVFPMSCSSDVDKLATTPEFLIDGWLEKDAHGIMYAESKAFKSFVVMHMAHCVATGQSFCGREIDKQGAVVFIIGEGKGGFYRRLKATTIQHGSTNDIHLIEAQPNISDLLQVRKIANTIKSVNPVLVVIDTFSSLASGVDENSNKDVAMVLALIRDSARSVDASSLIVHHTGKDTTRGSRGAYAFKGNVDFEYQLERSGDSLNTTLSNEKMKDAEQPKPLLIELEQVDIDLQDKRGYPVTSLAFNSFVCTEKGAVTPQKNKSAQFADAVMRAMNQISANHYMGARPVKLHKDHKGKMVVALTRAEVKDKMFELGDLHYEDDKLAPSSSDNRAVDRAIIGLKKNGKLLEKENRIWIDSGG